jgi:hypothetical protein
MTAEEFKALSNWKKVRILTGIIPQSGDLEQDNAALIDRMAICCLISRVEEGDASPAILNKIIDNMFGAENEAK